METEFCCEPIKKILPTFKWYFYEEDGTKKYTMACIGGFHVNYCPSCGKKIRGITLNEEEYNKLMFEQL